MSPSLAPLDAVVAAPSYRPSRGVVIGLFVLSHNWCSIVRLRTVVPLYVKQLLFQDGTSR